MKKKPGCGCLFLLCIGGFLLFGVMGPPDSGQIQEAGEPTKLAKNKLTNENLKLYQKAEEETGIPWSVLAAIHWTETNFGDTSKGDPRQISHKNAQGPMQFLPSTWEEYGMDGNGDGKADIWNKEDAIISAAHYLKAHGGVENIRKAVWAYNHSNSYVNKVLQRSTLLAKGLTDQAMASTGKMAMPVQGGTISDSFGDRIHPIKKERRFHDGTDIAAPKGTPVNASADGTVTYTGYMGAYGNTVIINHGGGVTTQYSHLSDIQAVQGMTVRQGQVVGKVGNTGWSTGPHLHFTVKKDGQPVNPNQYVTLH